MRIIEGATKSGKTRYVISEYIVPKLKLNGEVYYHGDMEMTTILDAVIECTGKPLRSWGNYKQLIKIDYIGQIVNIGKGSLIVVDRKNVHDREIGELEKICTDHEVIIIKQVDKEEINMESGNVIDNGKYKRFIPETYEVY